MFIFCMKALKYYRMKQLATKNEIIKSLIEIQSAVFGSLSGVRNNPAMFDLQQNPVVYTEPFQNPKMNSFVKIVTC